MKGIPILRTLTRKSLFGVGKDKDLRVQKMLDLRKQKSLVSAYFKLTCINYTEDLLQELGITTEYRIEKPGTDPNKWQLWVKKKRKGSWSLNKEGQIHRRPEARYTKSYLRSKNQKK